MGQQRLFVPSVGGDEIGFEQEEVDRPLPEYLVGEMDIPVLGVLRRCRFGHRCSVLPMPIVACLVEVSDQLFSDRRRPVPLSVQGSQ